MKVCTGIVATALTVSTVTAALSHNQQPIHLRSNNDNDHAIVGSTAQRRLATTGSWIDSLTPIANSDTYHMKPVRAIQARVQGDAPAWDTDKSMFTSAYGATFDARFRASLDTVNTASVEGALMYVQAEGINYNARSEADRCVRKNKMKYVVFYDIVFAQTNETLALYETEYGPFLPMDGGQCTPVQGADATAVFSQPCDYINGDNGEPQIGPFVGGELKDTDVRAPYPNTYWYSFPNTAVKSKWAAKTDASRSATRRGLCDYDKLPDGVTCTFNYRIAGYVPIDDIVGITAMQNVGKNATYKSFAEFCAEGGVEFNGSVADGTWEKSIDFWLKPKDSAENAKRATKVVETYAAMLTSKTSAQINATEIAHMTALPTVAALTAANPACYFNVKACSGANGCKRSLYGQICTACTTTDTGCAKPDSAFTYPTLTKAVGKSGGAGNKDATATTASTATPTPTPTTTPSTTTAAPTPTPSTTKSGAAGVSLMGLASVATLALSFFMG